MLLAIIGFFAMAVLAVYVDPVTAFILSPSRFWELLLGALLACRSWPTLNAVGMNILSWIGAAALVFAAVTFTPHTLFPAWPALVPCLGALLVLYAGSDKVAAYSFNSLLSWRPIVWVGLLSYSLYLWHWPLIVFYKYIGVADLAAWSQAVLAGMSMLFAYLSWRFVETPFRQRRLLSNRWPLLATGSVAMVIATLIGIGISWQKGMPWRFDPKIVAIERDQLYVNYLSECRQPELASDDICIRGHQLSAPSFLLLGDSHAGSISAGVFAAAQSLELAGVQLTVPSYRPFLEFGRQGFEHLDHQVDDQLEQLLATHPEISTIIILAHWRQAIDVGYTDPEGDLVQRQHILEMGLNTLIDRYRDRHFVVIKDFPIHHTFGANRFARQIAFGYEPDIGIPKNEHRRAGQPIERQFKSLASLENVTTTNLDDLFCDELLCYGVRDSRSLYRDADHLSFAGAMQTVPFFMTQLQKHIER